MTYLLSFITMFGLVYYLTNANKKAPVFYGISGCLKYKALPAAFSGLAYALSAYHLAHFIHPTLYNIQWLPLFVLSLFVLKNNQTFFFTLTASLMLAITTYSDAYYGFFASVIFLLFALYKRLKVKTIITFSLLSLMLIIPFVLWSRVLWIDRLNLIVTYSASWYDYIYPYGQKAVENVLYIPLTLLLIALFGIKNCDRFFVVLFLIAFGLSLSPPMLSIFRASTRWGLIVSMCVSVLGGYGMRELIDIE